MIQAAFVPLGDGEDYPIGNTGLYWNLYTAPAWLSVFLSLVNILALMPFIFTEYNIAKEEGDFLAARGLKKAEMDQVQVEKIKPDKLALVICILITATIQFHTNFIER